MRKGRRPSALPSTGAPGHVPSTPPVDGHRILCAQPDCLAWQFLEGQWSIFHSLFLTPHPGPGGSSDLLAGTDSPVYG